MTNLQSFKKANKKARLRMAERSGLTVEAYLKLLIGGEVVAQAYTAPAKKRGKRRGGNKEVEVKTAHSVHILDCSGSMQGAKLFRAIEGINNENLELKGITDVNWKGYLVHFSSNNDIRTEYWGIPVANIAPINFGARDWTALNDAIGGTLERLIREIPAGETVIVKVFTDGIENHSVKYKARDVKQLVQAAEARNIILSYQGASQAELDNAITNYGTHTSNTFLYENSAAGVAGASATRSASMKFFSAKVAKGEDVKKGFYKKINKI